MRVNKWTLPISQNSRIEGKGRSHDQWIMTYSHVGTRFSGVLLHSTFTIATNNFHSFLEARRDIESFGINI